jgi:hypothetical protein
MVCVSVGAVFVGTVGDVLVSVAPPSIVTLPRSSPQALTPAEMPAPSAAATSRIPAFRTTGVRVA